MEELELGLHAMAAPVRDRDGEVIAALSASGSDRFTEERMHELAPVLVKGAEEISHRMGYLGLPAPLRPGVPRRSFTQLWKAPMWCSLGTSTPPLAYIRVAHPGLRALARVEVLAVDPVVEEFHGTADALWLSTTCGR